MQLQLFGQPPASSGGKASYNEPSVWVFRLSCTKTMRSAVGQWMSTKSRMTCAQSLRVRRSITTARRQPRRGSEHKNTLPTPCRSYS